MIVLAFVGQVDLGVEGRGGGRAFKVIQEYFRFHLVLEGGRL